jgi:hypothetical protein
MWGPDAEAHPRFATAIRASATIVPGDVLVVPAFWWHAVESLSPALSISVRVDRTSLLEVWYEILDALHHMGLFHAQWEEEEAQPEGGGQQEEEGEGGVEGMVPHHEPEDAGGSIGRVARCTCHRDVVHMETLQDLLTGTSHSGHTSHSDDHVDGRGAGRGEGEAEDEDEDDEEVVRGAERGVPELCWRCCDSWGEAIASPQHGCLPRYEACYEAFDDDEMDEFLECVQEQEEQEEER